MAGASPRGATDGFDMVIRRSMRFTSWALTAGYGFLAVACGLLLARPRGMQPLDLVESALGGAVSAQEQPTVVLLLNPKDCSDRIEALTAWNPLHDSNAVRVVGLVSDLSKDPRALQTIRMGAGMRFPLQFIPHDQMVAVLRGLNYSSTPVAVVLDSRQRLRMAVPLFEQDTPALIRAALLQVRSFVGDTARPSATR